MKIGSKKIRKETLFPSFSACCPSPPRAFPFLLLGRGPSGCPLLSSLHPLTRGACTSASSPTSPTAPSPLSSLGATARAAPLPRFPPPRASLCFVPRPSLCGCPVSLSPHPHDARTPEAFACRRIRISLDRSIPPPWTKLHVALEPLRLGRRVSLHGSEHPRAFVPHFHALFCSPRDVELV